MDLTLKKLNNQSLNSFNIDKYFYNTSEFVDNCENQKLLFLLNTDTKNLNSNYNNFMKIDNTFLNNNLDSKSLDSLVYKNYFSTYNYNQSLSFNKIYIPKVFNASQSNIYNGLPWFLDYVHLSFWFFFFTIVVTSLFIIYFFNFVWNNQENKYPIRETRGFSRAQTGDTMTAIIPMTWSITMLMHASTHSSNFDENTTGTQFCLTVIAYQWGWNYYYPKDIVSIFNSMPIKVGHNNIDYYSVFDDYYSKLLDMSRNQILTKNFSLGIGSSKVGKNNIQTLQSLFFKPYGLNQNWELPTVLFINLNYNKNNYNLKSVELENTVKKYIQQVEDLSLNYTYNNNDVFFSNLFNINNLNNNNFNYFFYLLNNNLNILNFYKNLKYKFFIKNFEFNTSYYKIINFNEILNQSFLTTNNLKKNNNNSFLKIKSLDSHRNKNTFYSSSNKLFLSYKYLLDEYNKPLSENYIKAMDQIQSRQHMVNCVRNAFKSVNDYTDYINNKIALLEYNSEVLKFLDIFNANINQWLLSNDYDYVYKNNQFWVNVFNWKKLNYDFKTLFIYTIYKNLNFNDFYKNNFYIFNNNLNILNFKKVYQSLLFTSTDNSYSFFNNSILTFEDFGLINSSTVKELWYKNSVYSSFYLFNLLDFFKFTNKYSFSNINKFLFNKFYINNNNYKFWEIDNNLLLAENNVFNVNVLFDNNIFTLNNNFIYFWPSFISDLSKNIKYFSTFQNTLANFLNYDYYLIRADYLMYHWFRFNKKYVYFFKIKKNKNKFFNIFFDFENNNFNFKQLNNPYADIIKLNVFDLFKFKLSNYIIFKHIYNSSKVNTTVSNLKLIVNNKNYSVSVYKNKLVINNILPLIHNFLIDINLLNSKLLLFNKSVSIKKTLLLFNNLDLLNNNNNNSSLWDIFFFNTSNNSILYFDKPIRVSLKFNDPLDFNFKLSSNISNIYYINKYLFEWQLNWSNYIKNYNLPVSKFYTGQIEKKNFSGYSNTKNNNNPTYDDSNFEDYKLQIFKNFDTSNKKNFSYWAKSPIYAKYKYNLSYDTIIDFEKFNFFKNLITHLPNTNDDIDVNYILKYLTFDVNMSRRNDHTSKFKVFWGPLFTKYVKKLILTNNNVSAFSSLNIKNINFFKNFNINFLKYDSFYLQNLSLQKNYFLSNLKQLSKYSNLELNFLKNNFFWNFSKLTYNSLIDIKKLNLLLYNNKLSNNDISWFLYKNNLNELFLYNSNFLNHWTSFWFFKDNLQNFSNKLFFNKNFKDNIDLLNKTYLITSFKDKELKNLFNYSKNSLYQTNDLIIKDINSIISYQNFFDIKNNNITSSSLQVNLFSNLNFLKYSNFENFKNIKKIYYDYYILQLQKSNKSRFDYKEINNNIPNIRRLRVSKGICLPSDFSIHIICASKDVIHSWAIPGLGIKIDCIPGFNSHRRVIFRWRGLYWGQCMEVCGRYHHWMPILIRIVHKDLFLSWCLSFLKALNNKNFKYEKYFFDEVLLLNWLSDSTNSIILEDFFKNILDKNNPESRLEFFKSQLLN